MDFEKLKQASKDYLLARKKFLDIANATSELSGNDNIVGRIGEFIAYQFLYNRNPRKNSNKSEKGFDIVCDDNVKVSVKTITHENQLGRTTRIKQPWDELLLIEIDITCSVTRIGHLTSIQFDNARHLWPNLSKVPYCKSSMLNPNGLIGKYGKVYLSNDLAAFNFL